MDNLTHTLVGVTAAKAGLERLSPGAATLLDVLDRRGVPWAVVTSADVRLATARLDAAGISPPVLITTDDVPVGKPDPAGYVLAAELLGVQPEKCLVVEDAEVGLQAARAAGVSFEMVVVDDGSTDGTRPALQQQMQTRPWLRCVAMTNTPMGKGNGQSAAFHAGFRLRDLRFVIGRIDLNQEIAGLDPLEVLERDDENLAGNAAAELGRLGTNVGIVGGLHRGPADPGIPTQRGQRNKSQSGDRRDQRDRQAAQRAVRSRTGNARCG